MMLTSAEETPQAKEYYNLLIANHRARFCAFRAYNGRFLDNLFKEAVQTCGQQISYFRLGSHHLN